jgi:hypothetical protein
VPAPSLPKRADEWALKAYFQTNDGKGETDDQKLGTL